MTERDDKELMEAYYRGDNEALGELYKRHYSYLLFAARSKLSDPSYANDILHEVFQDFLRKTGSKRRPVSRNGRKGIQNVKAYFRAAIVYKCFDNKVFTKQVLSEDMDTLEWMLNNTRQVFSIEESEMSDLIHRVGEIAGLVGNQARVFYMYCNWYKPREIAIELGIDAHNASATLHTAKAKISKKVAIIAKLIRDEYYP